MQRLFISVIIIVTLVCSCSEYEKVLKSNDNNYKFKKAILYFNDKEFAKTQELIEKIRPIFQGTSKSQTIDYYYAFCLYEQKQYFSAAYYFNNFVKLYPNSSYAEECLFMESFCYYKFSPVPLLDQQPTIRAIEGFQLYVNRYPNSNRIDDVNKYIDELENKLVYKSYLSAKNYFIRERYRAAIIALQNAVKDYPNSFYREEILFMLLQSRYKMALRSIISKKIDRYNAAKEEYLAFIDEYPESKFIKDANRIYEAINNYLNQIEITGEIN